ncbi:MAG: glutamate--tRNA ligase [Bacilli bacterium]|nr:glutamate--tRNA ligase [Bacilli bacterium]
MTREESADLLLPGVKHDYSYYENLYPQRNLPDGAIVTRYAPSPTGFIHIGALLQSFISSKMAKQSNGIFFLRIEDTDQKRSIDDGVNKIIRDLEKFDIVFDEGVTKDGDKGSYGPYTQSERKDIYWAFAKKLIIEDKAYPCFCSKEDEALDREKQTAKGERTGYYGYWARCRRLTMEEVIEKINAGEKYIIRLKSNGNFNRKFKFKDCVKGKAEFPENDQDIPIIKSDGLPTYHFAHAIDDHLMGTTHVIRSDEWYPSIPLHTQLFTMLGFKVPKYAHISPLMIEDNGTRRKISKRKDPEAAVSFYHEKGIPNHAIMLYLATVTNSNFEMWMEQNKDKDIDDFTFEFNKMATGGTMFDYDKLINISKNYISKLKATEVYDMALDYAKEYNQDFASLLEKYKDYSIDVFNIEREQKKPRKDIAYFSDAKNQTWYMYDELFKVKDYDWQKINDKKEIKLILNPYFDDYYDMDDDKDIGFNKMKDRTERLGYTSNMKEYKANPDNYKGSIADVSMVIRVALTTLSMTPDLYEIMKLLGVERMKKRVEMALQ